MKSEVLKAWDVAVAAFRYCEPEKYITFRNFWLDPFGKGNEEAGPEAVEAFGILSKAGLSHPAFVADGE